MWSAGQVRRLAVVCLCLASATGGANGEYKTYVARDGLQVHFLDGLQSGVITTDRFGEPPWRRSAARYGAVWALNAPVDHTVIVYMTQYHLAEGDLLVESFNACYKEWDDPASIKLFWGSVRDARHKQSSVVNVQFVNRTVATIAPHVGDRCLVLRLDLPPTAGVDTSGACLQSDDSYGFNLTYEVVSLAGVVPGPRGYLQLARPDRCCAEQCHMNGDCMVTADFRTFYCRCRPGFHGKGCEYGPVCDPANDINPCQNAGKCRQRRHWVQCLCPLGYDGTRCQRRLDDVESPDDVRRYNIDVMVNESDIHLTNNNIEKRLGFPSSRFYNATLQFVKKREPERYGPGLRLLSLSMSAPRSYGADLFSWVTSGVNNRILGRVDVLPERFSFRSDPALLITSLTKISNTSVTRSDPSAQFTCRVVGSEKTEVQWYKDGAFINVTRASKLREHSIRVSRYHLGVEAGTNHYLTMALLEPHDEGMFECRASDEYGTSSRRIRLVMPHNHLQPYVTPTVTYVRKGGNVTLTCSLRMKLIDNAIFIWSKQMGLLGFQPLHGHDHEQIVTYCWGRSVLVISNPQTARYQCTVQNGQLMKSVIARVVLIRPNSLICPRTVADNVTWQETLTESEDIQQCPGDPTNTIVPGKIIHLPIRYARRKCVRPWADGPPEWAEPNFSQCTDDRFVKLQRSINHLLAGYDVMSIEDAVGEVSVLMQQRLKAATARQLQPGEQTDQQGRTLLLRADAEAFRRLLHSLVTYLLAVATDEELSALEAPLLTSMAPLLTADGAHFTDQAKADLLLKQLAVLERSVFSRHPAPARSQSDVFVGAKTLQYDGVGKRLTIPSQDYSRSAWLRTTAHIWIEPSRLRHYFSQTVSTLGVVVVVNRHARDLFPRGYTPVHNAEGPGRSRAVLTLDSRVVSLGLGKRPRQHSSPTPPDLAVNLLMAPSSRHSLLANQSYSCARLSEDGRWLLDVCQLAKNSNYSFNCSCRGAGIFALALVTTPRSALERTLRRLHVPVTVGCVLSLPLLLYTAGALLLLCWRRPSVAAALQLQCAGVLSVAMLVFLVSSRDSPPRSWLAVVAAALQCLILSAQSTQLAIKMHVFGEQNRLYRLPGRPNYFKYMVPFLSLGVPVLVMAATVTTQHTHGWDSVHSWWIVHTSSFFYGVVLPVAALLLLDTLLHIYVRALLLLKVARPKLQSSGWVNSRLDLMLHSHLIEVTLVLLVIASALYINFGGVVWQVVFAACCVLTSVAVFTCYVVRGNSGALIPPCCSSSSAADASDKDAGLDLPATLRSHGVLLSTSVGHEPPLPRCHCRSSTRPSPPASASASSAETDQCTAFSTGDSATSESCPPADDGTPLVRRTAAMVVLTEAHLNRLRSRGILIP